LSAEKLVTITGKAKRVYLLEMGDPYIGLETADEYLSMADAQAANPDFYDCDHSKEMVRGCHPSIKSFIFKDANRDRLILYLYGRAPPPLTNNAVIACTNDWLQYGRDAGVKTGATQIMPSQTTAWAGIAAWGGLGTTGWGVCHVVAGCGF
jgi:hypothetical protein